MKIKIIAAIGKNNEIGTKDNQIPWKFHPEDMTIFSSKTKSESGTILLGSKTFFSLPEKFRPLPNRRNLILSDDVNLKLDGVEVFHDRETLLKTLIQENIETLWIGGGGQIYKLFFEIADELHISHFNTSSDQSSVFFPEIKSGDWEEISQEKHLPLNGSPSFVHKVYHRKS